MTTRVIQRQSKTAFKCEKLGSLLSKIFAARGVGSSSDISRSLKELIPHTEMMHIEGAAQLVIDSIKSQDSIVVVGDFDADGATSTALLVSFLKKLGVENCNFIIPNRFDMGYGLSKTLIDLAIEKYDPQLIITVDNGVTAVDEVKYIKDKGIAVVVTDHHMPGEDGLPEADFIVNPNLEGNHFPSKNLAGVGVAFYLAIAIRDELRKIDYFNENDIPTVNLAEYLDLVALGTVADMVDMDKNNRIMVHQGLLRIRNGYCRPGIGALLAVSQKDATTLTASDLGYAIGPRLNAAGRVSEMSIGVQCLLTTNYQQADILAEKLHDLNLERRQIELEMQTSAQGILDSLDVSNNGADLPLGICLYDESWHQGVAGIIASRIKDKFKRPVVILSRSSANNNEDEKNDGVVEDEELKGSARSIKGLDIRQALANINEKHPDMIEKFGGHKGAAGLTIKLSSYEAFSKAFNDEISSSIGPDDCFEEIKTDGPLEVGEITLDTAQSIRDAGPWGMNFTEPVFMGDFNIMEQRIVGQRHLKVALQPKDGYEIINGIYFNIDLKQWPDFSCTNMRIVYKLDITEYRGASQLQLIITHIEKITVDEEVGILDF